MAIDGLSRGASRFEICFTLAGAEITQERLQSTLFPPDQGILAPYLPGGPLGHKQDAGAVFKMGRASSLVV